MCFSARLLRMPAIIEAWLCASENTAIPGNSRARVDKRRVIGDIARGEDQRRLAAVQVGELVLEQEVQVAVAGDVARAAGAGTDRAQASSIAARTAGCWPMPR